MLLLPHCLPPTIGLGYSLVRATQGSLDGEHQAQVSGDSAPKLDVCVCGSV